MRKFIFINVISVGILLVGCIKKNQIVVDHNLNDCIYFEKERFLVLSLADTMIYGQWIKKQIGDTLRDDIRLGRGNIINTKKFPTHFVHYEKIERDIMAYKNNDTIFLLIYIIPSLVKTIILEKNAFYCYEIFQGYHSPSSYDETYRSETFLKIQMSKSELKFKYNRFEIGDTIYGYVNYTTQPYNKDRMHNIVENFKGAFKTIILCKDTFDKIEPFAFVREETKSKNE